MKNQINHINREKSLIKGGLFALFLFLTVLSGYGQQDPQYTDYMYNPMSVNPAYAGSRNALSFVGLMRIQWVGIEGAPRTQSFTVHSPVFNKKTTGLGLSFFHDKVGPIDQSVLNIDYSHGIKVSENSMLRFGLKAGFGVYQGNLLDLNAENPNDGYIYNFKGRILPNIGVGVFYYSQKGYLGLSLPRILTYNLQKENGNELSYTKRHYFFTGGYVFDLTNDFKFKPSFLLKAVEGAPLSIDLSGILYAWDKLGLGVNYRVGDSFAGLIQYYITNNFRVGYAYDYTLTPLKQVNSGTHEFMLGYDFNYLPKGKILSPRFF
jgi:type IX secretion system PorP/SprF family membrane protein